MITMAIANIVDIDDFIGRYALSVSDYGEEKFNDFITQEQYDLLIEMFGAALYNTYDTTPATAEWVSLLAGETYTGIDGYTYNWKGLKYLMKPFIFSRWINSDHLKSAQSGMVAPQFENATKGTEYQRKRIAFKRWNEFVDRWNECYSYLWAKNSSANNYDEFYVWWIEKFKDGMIVKSNIL